MAAPAAKLDGHEIIQSAPTTYVVDEARGVHDPSGMFCQRIGVAMHAVAVKPVAACRISSWRWSAAISMSSGTLFARLCLAALPP